MIEIREWCNDTESTKSMTYTVIDWFDADLGIVVTAYFLWTGLFHLPYSTILWTKLSKSLQNNQRWSWRWNEFISFKTAELVVIRG